MKLSDYIVNFFVEKGVKDIFGYQGTMIAHFVDSIYANPNINNHVCYNEQGAAFAAVGHAKATKKFAVAYSTSGPAAANLVSGVADAYYDSVPVLFITGQLNSYEYFDNSELRQHGFQEMNVISMVKDMTKYAKKIIDPNSIKYELEKAYSVATSGRPGPVVLDIPMDVQRAKIDVDSLIGYGIKESNETGARDIAKNVIDKLNESDCPVIVLGNGVDREDTIRKGIVGFAEKNNIPVITSMLGKDIVKEDSKVNFGYIGGAYGHRYANLIASKKSDLIVALGCSLCKRQTTTNYKSFAEDAEIIRVDIDKNELLRKVHDDEVAYLADCNEVIREIIAFDGNVKNHEAWILKCDMIKMKLKEFDDDCKERLPNKYIEEISKYVVEGSAICADVGQHQVWSAQSFGIKDDQKMLFSGGHGAMGFALPASIGACYATNKRSYAICGDGAMQMNIQELQWLAGENLPVTVFVMNNSSLGLIQQQQDDIFDSRYAGSVAEGGYNAPNFKKVAEAYGIEAYKVRDIKEVKGIMEKEKHLDGPMLVEIILDVDSRAFPKTPFGEPMYNQYPYISEELLNELLAL